MGLVYTKLKVFHFKEKLDSLPASVDKVLPPVHIRIKPTNVCNHNCSYCAYRVDNLQLGKDMVVKDFIPEAKMMEIIDDIIDMKVKAVTFSGGGDPFCYQYLLKSVKRLADSPVKFASLTNGSKLRGEVAEVFAHHATWLRISIDGWDAQSYADYRGVSLNEFPKIMKNMQNFKKLGGNCFLGVSIVVDQKNANHVYELIKKLKDVGADSVKVSACIISNDARENNKYHKPVFQGVKDDVARAIAGFSDDCFEINDSYHELDDKFIKEHKWCPYLQILPVIGADLNIYPCQDKAYNLEDGLIGSIKEVSFKDFWMSDKSKFFKINPSVHCDHHCVANMKNKSVLEYLGADKEHLGFV